MSNLSDFLAGGGRKSARTLITTGSGTFVPSTDNALCRVRVQSGGGGGPTAAYGGGAGAMLEVWIRVPVAGLAYVVGAGGAAGASPADGGVSSLGPYSAIAGQRGGPSVGFGGYLAATHGLTDTSIVNLFVGHAPGGCSGGGGGSSTTSGKLIGFPNSDNSVFKITSLVTETARASNGQGNSSGGNSFYGKGGTAGNAPAADAYGAGGGNNGAGRGGCIDIEDFGA